MRFLGVGGQASPDDARGFVERFGLDGFPHVADPDSDFRASLGGVSRSTFLFVDDDGEATLTSYGQMNADRLRELAQQLIDG